MSRGDPRLLAHLCRTVLPVPGLGALVLEMSPTRVCYGSSEVFPLPSPIVEALPRDGLSRGCVQRVQRRRRHCRAVAEVVDGLNWLAGAGSTSVRGEHLRCHSEVWRHVEQAVLERASVPFVSPSEAARTILGHKAGYGHDVASNVRPYMKGAVSLPGSTAGGPLTACLARLAAQ